jgi:hypothetical protein
LQKDLNTVGKWAAENAMKINPSKCKALCFARPLVKNPLNYTLGDQLIPEASSCKYLRIGTREGNRFCFSAKQATPFKFAGWDVG